ncbi:MAG: serine/threonine-protein phosphatase [Acidobacteria bacterium]|nr:serine/threonine-protein phosphatase [Acidobacteriota bacterium]
MDQRHSPEALASRLVGELVQGQGMNDFLHRFLTAIGNAFAAPRQTLYDYDENTGRFELLYFSGYPASHRSELHRRMLKLDLQRAISDRGPYWSGIPDACMLIPLYFQDTLEAVLLLEPRGAVRELDERTISLSRIVSRFLGLFMSSSRLPVNQQWTGLSRTDLERAREVQRSYLPAVYPESRRCEIYGHNQSSAIVGGDYFDVFRERESSIQGVVADACGHGMAAALIMSTFRGLLQSEVRQPGDIRSLFTRLNRRLYSGGDLIQYLTGIFFEFREETGELRYFNAGHFEPLLMHADGSFSQLPGGGPPLGMFRDSEYAMHARAAGPGDLLVLFTDGLAELRSPRDEFFGVGGIMTAVSRRRTLPLRELAAQVLAEAAAFSGRPDTDDDLTLFLMRVR